MTNCTVKDCNNKHKAKGYCVKHYHRSKRGYDMNVKTKYDPRPAIIDGGIAKIPLGVGAKNDYAIVDKEFAWLEKYKWVICVAGYSFNSKIGLLHHQIIGKPEKGYEVDHKNRDRLDNRLCNLRIITHHQNCMNMSKPSNNTSGYKGVSWNKNRNKWVSYINFNNKRITLGYYDTPEQAALKYNDAAINYFGEYANLNNIG